MSDKKILSPAETLRALGEGKKVTYRDWQSGSYLHLVGKSLVDKRGNIYPVFDYSNFYEFTEPKPKRKLAPYIYTNTYTQEYQLSRTLYSCNDEFLKMNPAYTIVRRVTELEVE